MNTSEKKAVKTFVGNLTGTATSEIQIYLDELDSNNLFHDTLEENRRDPSRRPNTGQQFGVSPLVGTAFYIIGRKLQPDNIVEAGVASGVSSSYFLCALEQNKRGQLYSIDRPWWEPQYTGWLIPDYLKQRWHLVRGKTQEQLVPLLTGLKQIDIYFHDSEHTYENMTWEYRTAWSHLKSGGVLLSHNIDWNDAFRDFCRSQGREGYVLENLGGVMKP